MGFGDIWRLCWPDNYCLLCGGRLGAEGGSGLCPNCRRELAGFARCLDCGGFTAPGEPCHVCVGRLPGRDKLPMLAAAPYDGRLRRLLLELKYRGGRRLARPMGALLAWVWEREALDFAPQVVVPVPLHEARQRQRGYNQSLLLARAFAGYTGLPVAEALVRLRDTEAQHSLSVRQREQNVAGAFAVAGAAGAIAGRRVLLLDDIITSGATARSCAEALEQAGCAGVCVLAVAGRLQK